MAAGTLLVIFTACWVTHAIPLATNQQCETLKPGILKTLSAIDGDTLFTAECHPPETDVKLLEHERWQTLACIWPDPRSHPARTGTGY
jgi:hypothetical protein